MFTYFLHSEVYEIHRAIFQRYHPGLLMADAMQNPCRLSVLGCVLKSEEVEGGVLKQIIWTFFILVDKRSLSTKVFMIIKISSKKWWRQKLGTEFSTCT